MTKIDSLYDRDFMSCCQDTAAKLKRREFHNLDIDNLIEEVESLGRSDRRELKNRLIVLLAHILKRMYVNTPENFNRWELTIIEQRQQIKGLLEDSPSLKPYLEEIFTEMYADALDLVRVEYKQTQFPDIWQFDTERDSLLYENYWE